MSGSSLAALLAALLAAVGCSETAKSHGDDGAKSSAPTPRAAQAKPATPNPTQENTVGPIRLSWTFERAADHLAVTYSLQNTGESAVIVLDQLLAFVDGGRALAPDAIIVETAGSTLRLSRGYVAPQADVRVKLIPGARRLAPGATVDGAARVPLPLSTWHPRDRGGPITEPISAAVLRIGTLPGDAPLSSHEIAGGAVIESPPAAYVHQHQRFIESAPRPLP